jgi:hypothetical protein
MTSLIALVIISAYRLIPCPIRRLWSFGTSTSALAMDAAYNREGFSSFRYAKLVIHGEGGDWYWLGNA